MWACSVYFLHSIIISFLIESLSIIFVRSIDFTQVYWRCPYLLTFNVRCKSQFTGVSFVLLDVVIKISIFDIGNAVLSVFCDTGIPWIPVSQNILSNWWTYIAHFSDLRKNYGNSQTKNRTEAIVNLGCILISY